MIRRASLLAALLFAGPALGVTDPQLLPPALGTTERIHIHELSGFGLDGYDPVTFFLGRPKPGRDGAELIWRGVAWRFASAANREAFRRDPELYAPRLGGYDAQGMARGAIVDADPAFYALIGGGLYLFRTREGRDAFRADPSRITEAEARWAELKGELVEP